MSDVRILWSGLTGETGQAAMEWQKKIDGVEIVVGMSRNPIAKIKHCVSDADGIAVTSETDFSRIKWLNYGSGLFWLYDVNQLIKDARANFLVDFSHPDVFEQVVELAVRTHVPLISGTSGLSDRQMAMLYDATNQIPVFRGGNFRFKVKKFIDEAVEFARNEPGQLDLYENFWEGKELPSETSKVLQQRIFEATGKQVEVHSLATFAQGNWISDWELRVQRRVSPTAIHQDKVHCRVIGYDELAHDVLEIAKVMAKKPVKKGGFYDLDEIWDEIPAEVKTVS